MLSKTDQFFRLFRKVARRYRFAIDPHSRQIRGWDQGRRVCPLTAVHLFKTGKYVEVYKVSQLFDTYLDSWEEACSLANAADGDHLAWPELGLQHPELAKLRGRLTRILREV